MAGDLMAIIRPVNAERRSASVRTESAETAATREQVDAAITRLTQIKNATGGTLAQTQTALQDVAGYVRAVIRVVAGA